MAHFTEKDKVSMLLETVAMFQTNRIVSILDKTGEKEED